MENENNQEIEKEEAPSMIGGLKSIGFGLAILGLAYYFYITMTSYENGEGVTMNRILLLAYGMLGKNITAGVLGIMGVLLAFFGAREIAQSQKSS